MQDAARGAGPLPLALQVGALQPRRGPRETGYTCQQLPDSVCVWPRAPTSTEPSRQCSSRSVTFCAICDWAFFQDMEVAGVGGGVSAVEEAVFLTRFASKAYSLQRRSEFSAQSVVVGRAMANPNIGTILPTIAESIHGTDQVE